MITLKTPPISVNQLYRGKKFLTAKGKAIKEIMGYEIKQQWSRKPLKCPIGLTFYFYISNNRSDLDNLLKATQDCLTGIIFEDDKQVIELHCYKKIDKDNPRIKIDVKRLSTD